MPGPGGTIFLTDGDDFFPVLGIDDNSGDETIWARNGHDQVAGGIGNDVIYGEGGNDDLLGQDGDDFLFGGDGDDSIQGGEGNDVIDPGLGLFGLIYGGAGNDVIATGQIINPLSVIDGGDGYDTLRLGDTVQLQEVNISGFENFTAFGIDSITATASQIDSFGIFGGFEEVGEGTLTFFLFGRGLPEFLDLSDQVDDPNYSVNLTGTVFADTLILGGGDDIIDGFWGDDWIEGGLGDDILLGNLGNDTVSYASAPGAVRIDLRNIFLQDTQGAGIDSIFGFENVEGSAFDDRLLGDSQDNFLYGLGGDDIFRGFGGEDTLFGGAGVDRLYGDAGNDIINGGADNDIVYAGGGNDTIDGNAGVDNMRGEAGDDIYYVDTADYVTELAGEGLDIVYSTAAITYLSANVENLYGLLATGQNLSGNAEANIITAGGGDDILYGNGGNDTIDGGAGTDNMRGNAGDDVYYVDTFDYVTELAGEGTDEVRSTAAVTYLSANVENLTGLLAGGQNLSGNGEANVISAGGGADIVYGNGGADTIFGGGGADNIRGGAGDDRIDGGIGSDVLFGGSSSDPTGSGADTFVAHGAAGYDGIYDFQGGAGAGDIVELNTIASGGLYADAAAAFAALREIGPHVFLQVDADSGVWFVNRTLAQLNADDFVLVA